jgi:hypothetical protein
MHRMRDRLSCGWVAEPSARASVEDLLGEAAAPGGTATTSRVDLGTRSVERKPLTAG